MLAGAARPRPALSRSARLHARSRGPQSLPGSDARRLRLGGMSCRTQEQDGGGLALQGDPGGGGGVPRGGALDPRDTFKQLRQAVLSSLDFSDAPEQAQDWDDSAYESAAEEIASETPGQSVSAVGKAVYETLRIDSAGRARRVYVRRRDLIRAHGLQPRDLRRVDPSLGPTKTSNSIAIKDDCVLINIGGVRAVLTADRCLLFEPASSASRRFLELVTPRLQASAAERARLAGGGGYESPGDAYEGQDVFPFELELLEGALMVSTGKQEAELVAATGRVGAVLQKLPREITPANLEELRRVKQLLVELESKADGLRGVLEELMDDEEEMQELNLSSRPAREEKRRQRERERLEREMEREWAEREERESARGGDAAAAAAAAAAATSPGLGPPASAAGVRSSQAALPSTSSAGAGSDIVETWRLKKPGGGGGGGGGAAARRRPRRSRERGDSPGEEGGEAYDALEEMEEEEEEERELEEVEDLLEYYLQRAATTQSEAERLLAGARDLEESIGVSLSARRFEVNRLELLLSIASFAAALGAMVASIFGMNLRSTLEMSVVGFWGTTALIVAGSAWVFWVLYGYTKRKRIL